MKVNISISIPVEIAKLLESFPNSSYLISELLQDYFDKNTENYEQKLKEFKQKHKEIVKNMKELKKKIAKKAQRDKKMEYIVAQEDTKEARFARTRWGK